MINELENKLASLRAKRKPAINDEQRAAMEREAKLQADIAAELRAIREEENANIKSKHAPNRLRRFFDFDPDGEQPATVEHNGVVCALYTRLVVRGANADQLERNSDAIVVRGIRADGSPDVIFDTAKTNAVMVECAESCIVYPTAAIAGVNEEQHKKNIKASLWHLGAARAEIGKAALELGGVDAAAHRSKS